MAAWTLRTPVTFIVFNRPEVTGRVFSAIAKAKPPVLLIVADGARVDRPDDAERVERVRAVVARVDWACDVRTSFSNVNLGCKRRVSTGLTWAFQQVSTSIVLEDDCLPHPSFFRFCEELLERFRDDKRVFQINGTNFQPAARLRDHSYYFSAQSHVWGWASWSDRWLDHYDVGIAAWPAIRDSGVVMDLVGGREEADYWTPILDRVYRGEIDTWDYQWAFACMLNAGSVVTPHVNLISNIGFGEDATHTISARHPLAGLATQPMEFPLKHPVGMFQSRSLDRHYFKTYSANSLRRRLANRLRRLTGRT